MSVLGRRLQLSNCCLMYSNCSLDTFLYLEVLNFRRLALFHYGTSLYIAHLGMIASSMAGCYLYREAICPVLGRHFLLQLLQQRRTFFRRQLADAATRFLKRALTSYRLSIRAPGVHMRLNLLSRLRFPSHLPVFR